MGDVCGKTAGGEMQGAPCVRRAAPAGRGGQPNQKAAPVAPEPPFSANLLRHRVLQGLAGLEDGHLGGGDFDALLRLGVAADAGGAALDLESAEAHQLDLVAVGEALGDGLQGGVEDALGVLLERPAFSAAALTSSALFILVLLLHSSFVSAAVVLPRVYHLKQRPAFKFSLPRPRACPAREGPSPSCPGPSRRPGPPPCGSGR